MNNNLSSEEYQIKEILQKLSKEKLLELIYKCSDVISDRKTYWRNEIDRSINDARRNKCYERWQELSTYEGTITEIILQEGETEEQSGEENGL